MTIGVFASQAEAKSVSAEDIYAAMIQPAPARNEHVDLAKRQAVLPALGYLPAATEAYLAFANIGQHICRAMSDRMLLDQPVAPAPPELAALESAALSVSEGTTSGLRLLLPMLVATQKMTCIEDWAAKANPEDARQMRTLLEQTLGGQRQQATAEFQQQWQMKPIYAVVTLKKGQEKMAEEWSKRIVSIALASHADHAEPLEYGEFRGVKISVPEAQYPALHNFCVMTKHCGTALILAICAKPEDIQLPNRVEDSALASPQLNACDAALSDLFMVSYGSAEFAKKLNVVRNSALVSSAEMSRLVFETLGAADASRKEVFDKAAAGVSTLLEQLNAVWGQTQKQECVMLCRLNENEFSLEYSEDADGKNYEEGQLRFVAQVAETNNIFYGESTPLSGATLAVDGNKIIPALLDAGRGYALTLPGEAQKEVEQNLNMLANLSPELAMLGRAFSTVADGLGHGGAVLMDSAGSLPSLFGGIKGNRVAVPRVAYCKSVTNRANLSRGWDEILGALGGFAGKMFGSPMLVQALAFPSKKVEDAVSYSLYMPICTEHMIPNVTVSDKSFVVGSSSAYNEKLVSAGTGNKPFRGAVFSLQLEPLAATMRGIADAYRSRIPAEEEAVPMSQVEDGEEVAAAAASGGSTQLEKLSETLEELATMAELAASVAESVHGTITIDNGRRTLRTFVRLQK